MSLVVSNQRDTCLGDETMTLRSSILHQGQNWMFNKLPTQTRLHSFDSKKGCDEIAKNSRVCMVDFSIIAFFPPIVLLSLMFYEDCTVLIIGSGKTTKTHPADLSTNHMKRRKTNLKTWNKNNTNRKRRRRPRRRW